MSFLKIEKILDDVSADRCDIGIYLHDHFSLSIKSDPTSQFVSLGFKFLHNGEDIFVPINLSDEKNLSDAMSSLSGQNRFVIEDYFKLARKEDEKLTRNYDFVYGDNERKLYFFKPAELTGILGNISDIIFELFFAGKISCDLDEYASRNLAWRLIYYSTDEMYERLNSIAENRTINPTTYSLSEFRTAANFYGNLSETAKYDSQRTYYLLRRAIELNLKNAGVVIPQVNKVFNDITSKIEFDIRTASTRFI